jgi:hypothetical protein
LSPDTLDKVMVTLAASLMALGGILLLAQAILAN